MTDAFDVCGPLPTGVTVLEASAGTGKTFTIAALAARYVAEGIPLEQILMVTFTRMATGELRERVRERLVSAEHGLERALAGAPPEDDAVVRLLATGSAGRGRGRGASGSPRALADFDSATIATTHALLPGGARRPRRARRHRVRHDVRGGHQRPAATRSSTTSTCAASTAAARRSSAAREAMAIASAAIDNPAAPIEPADAPDHPIEAMRVRLAGAARKELEARKRRMGVMTYDDLLTRLSDTLEGEGGAVAAARLRDRYRVVLVDEFQDTDPVQWRIMQTAFGDGETTLVLIGDPKQAIYAFRGADVYAYIEARTDRRHAGHADGQLAQRPGPDRRLRRAVRRREARARGDRLPARSRAANRGRAPARRAGPGAAADPGRPARRGRPDRQGLRAARARARSTSPATSRPTSSRCCARAPRSTARARSAPATSPCSCARTSNASRVRDALEAVDVPAVINGAGSVFGTEPAREWLRVLEAIERPSYPPRARSAALTTILGWTTEQVAAADDDAWEGVHRRLHHWARVLRVKGVASLMEAITLEEGLPARVLGDGRRRAPDDRPPPRRRAAPRRGDGRADGRDRADGAGCAQRVLEAAQDNNDEERSRRLESDAEAVQVLTMHRSKGLEFPVVYYPDLWEPSLDPERQRARP